MILSNFRRVELVPYRSQTVPYQTQTFFKNSLETFDVPYYRTINKNLELFLKTRIFLATLKISSLKTRIFRYEFYENSNLSLKKLSFKIKFDSCIDVSKHQT